MPVAQPQYKTFKKNVKLAPGQTLGFTQGKGYYAKPPPKVGGAVGPAPGGGGAATGGTHPGPNYGADLVGAPDFTEANANYEYGVGMAHANRQNRVRAALIKLGFQPGSADAAALAGVDPSTAELAANNAGSALAQLGLQRGQQRGDLAAQLAERGLLDSGALRGGENMVQASYDQGLLNATQDYLNEQNAALYDESNALATGQTTFTAAKAAAAAAAATNPLFTPTEGAGAQGNTNAPGQGTRPDQTPVLAKPPVATGQIAAPPARYYTYAKQVKLRPGQKLRFAQGKGYYAA